MNTNRLQKTIFNSISNVLVLFSTTILSFILRTFFIKILGEQCLGLDGLFTNILSLLSLSELGISTAISYSLYKPLATENKDKINKIMSFYKKIYQSIAFLILIFSLVLLPFLHLMVKDYNVSYNIYLIYGLYVLDTILSYLTSYKVILIEADQKNYKLTSIKILFNFLTYGLQLTFLLCTKNLIWYLIIRVGVRQVERIVTNIYIGKKYPAVQFQYPKKIDKEDGDEIKKNVKGIIFHKIGNYAVNGTDNILISSIVNIATTGIYSNYLSIVSIIRNFIGSIVVSATASFGNLNVNNPPEVKLNVFNIMDFVCFFLTGLFAIGIYFLINSFITLWIGSNYTVNIYCVILITMNFYLNAMLLPIDTVKDASGKYYQDRYVPIIQTIINITLSFLLGYFMGLPGILLATTISYLSTVSWSKAYIVYKYIFDKNVILYLKKQCKNLLILFLSILVANFVFSLFHVKNLLFDFILKGCTLTFIFCIFFIVFYIRSNEFHFFKNLILQKLKKT